MTGALIDYAKFLGALATIVASIGALSRIRPVRWIVRTLVGDPLGGWFRREVDQAVRESETGKLVKHHLQANGTTPAVVEEIAGINRRLDGGARHFRRLEARLDDLEGKR